MVKIQVFDPALCCSTGVCGPGVDPVLPRFASDLEWLKGNGVEVERYNLAQQVAAFTGNPTVKAVLNRQGTTCLPLILVGGAIVAQGSYPTREELAGFVEAAYEPGPNVTPATAQSTLVSIGGPGKAGRGEA